MSEEETFYAEDDIPDICKVSPTEAFMSTDLNSKIKSYEDLATRILNMLGYPAVGITDIHSDQINEAISIACEMFTKQVGYNREYLVVDSKVYEKGRGFKLDKLFTIASLDASHYRQLNDKAVRRNPDQTLTVDEDVYVNLQPIALNDYYISDKDYEILENNVDEETLNSICLLRDFSKLFPNGVESYNVIPGWLYKHLIDKRNYTKEQFKKSKNKVATLAGEKHEVYNEDETYGLTRDTLHWQKTFDYDLMDYRRVTSVVDWTEGTSTSISSLFSLDTALAQQTYYSYAFSLRGFDMTTYTCFKLWNKERERILATKRNFSFNKFNQYLNFFPEPREYTRFYGVLECYVEKPLREIIKETWVFKYALALVKEMLGRVRSKYGDSIQLLGGGIITGNALLQEGIAEKKELEQQLFEKRGFGDAAPPRFFIG